jgi:hypothetical protein
MYILPTANTVLLDTVQLIFHQFSLHPMTLLQERPETVRDACQTELHVDLVASLRTASVLHEFVVLADQCINAMERFSSSNGLYWTKDGKMWIPDDQDLRYELFLDCHASVLAGHMGRDKTSDQIKWYFYWKDMSQDISEFVQKCHSCQT